MIDYLKDETRVDLREGAMEHWHRSLELDPNQPRVRKLIAKYRRSTDDPYKTFLGIQDDTPR